MITNLDSILKSRDKWFLDRIKPELSLEASILKLRLFYFGHHMRRQ